MAQHLRLVGILSQFKTRKTVSARKRENKAPGGKILRSFEGTGLHRYITKLNVPIARVLRS